MKNLLKLSLFSFMLISLSCSDDNNDTLTGNELEGGLVDKATASVTYPQGQNPDELLSSSFSIFQGTEKVESVEVYKQFFGKVDVGTPDETTLSSNKALLMTVDMPLEYQYETATIEYSYNDLISGLTFNGAPLSSSDLDLNIGDYWVLTFVSHLTNGNVHSNVQATTTVTMACGSYLAGTYNLITTITAGNGVGSVYSLPGEELTSLDGTRYKGASIGPYNDRGLISPNAQIAGVGLVFDDICGQIILWQDPSWNYSTQTGVPDGTAQFLGPYYNAVYQTASQIENSTVDAVSGVITIEYNVWFSAGTRSYVGVYTPQ